MPIDIVQVDAFTNRPFTGNPAAVCILTEPPADWWLKDVAREMNLSETAFLHRHEEGFDLRWFTPTGEVDLCGHATLASAHVLWEDGHVPADETIRFHTRTGELTARKDGEWIELDFPADPPVEAPAPEGLARALGAEPVWVGKGRSDYLVELSHEKTIRTLRPDFSLLAKIDTRAIIVTAAGIADRIDFVSRCFGPRVGIQEDPVTGSAHCTLASYWAAKTGKTEMIGYQVSDRGGTVRVSLQGDRVLLGGQAVIVLRGTLLA